jgi:hypothetical protein
VEEISRACAIDMPDFYREMRNRFLDAETGPFLTGTVDQKGVIMRHDSLRAETAKRAAASEPRLESRLASGEKPNRKRMATVAAVYTVSPFVRTGEEVIAGLRHLHAVKTEETKSRPRPEYKRVWASLEADVPMVVNEMFDELERRDPHKAKRWLLPIDGDEKLERTIRKEASRRGVTVTIILDFIHALEYIWKAGHSFFDSGSKELEEWVLEHLKRMLEGKAGIVAAAMRRMATTRGLDEKKREQVDRSANYLLKRKGIMKYDKLLELGAPISSGVIEGTCRSLINDRLGLTGARWGLAGAEAILLLRAILRSGDWEEYWSFHTQAEFRRNHASRYADGQPPSVEIPKHSRHLRRVM